MRHQKHLQAILKQVTAVVLIILLNIQGIPAVKSGIKQHRIMCIGDSITESEKRENSWRYKLVQLLYDNGYKDLFDMVGRNSGFFNNPDTGWDSEHCGYYSSRADQLLNGGLPRGKENHGSIKDWASQYKATIAIIHLGTNDSRQSQSPESTLKDIGDIIRHLRDAVPDVKVVVAQIIPIGVENAEMVAQDLNRKIPAWAKSIATDESPVKVVDMHADMQIGRDQDMYHPYGEGSRKMAVKWYDAIKEWLDNEVAVSAPLQIESRGNKNQFSLPPLFRLNSDNRVFFSLDGRKIVPDHSSHSPGSLLLLRDRHGTYKLINFK